MKRAEEATFRQEKQDSPIIEATKDVYLAILFGRAFLARQRKHSSELE